MEVKDVRKGKKGLGRHVFNDLDAGYEVVTTIMEDGCWCRSFGRDEKVRNEKQQLVCELITSLTLFSAGPLIPNSLPHLECDKWYCQPGSASSASTRLDMVQPPLCALVPGRL